MAYRPHKFIRDKLAKTRVQRQFWRIFLIEAMLFLAVSLLALLGAFKLNTLIQKKKIYMPSGSLQKFLLSFLAAAFLVFLFVLLRNKKFNKFREIVFKGLFILACFWGGMAILNLFLPVFAAIFVAGSLIFLWLWQKKVWVHDVLMVLGLAGASSFFGLEFSPSAAVIILLIFSIYDFVAVYKTKHMILMAKEMIEKKVILGLIVPKELKYFKDDFGKAKPGENFLILGGGDVIFPSLLAVSLVPSSFLKAFIIVVFSIFGSFFAYWIFTKEKEAIPALPPIAFFAILGYVAVLLF